MANPTTIGIGESLAAEFFVSGIAGAEKGYEVVRLQGRSGLDAVRQGAVDLALVPALSIIADTADIDVVPAVAMSSWRYPFAQLLLPGGLEASPERILYESRHRVEADLARIILKEHYGISPVFEPNDVIEVGDMAALVVGNSVPTIRFRGLRLDLGQEWFELANYPMVWGLLVMAKGSVTAEVVNDLRNMAARTEKLRTQWADSTDQSQSTRRFFLEDVRVRFDDLVTASLSQLLDYAFYYDLTDEIREFPLAAVEINEADRGPTPIL